MSTTINDGTGNGFSAKVDSGNRLLTRSVSNTEYELAITEGRAFNVNTEFLTIGTASPPTTENAILYLKNNEDEDIIIVAWFIGTADSQGTATDVGPLLKVYTNPTGGTIVSSGTDVVPVNRKIGDNNTFDITVKKATSDGFTLTGQDTTPVLYQTQPSSGRVFAGSVYVSLQRGASLGVVFIPNGAEPVQIYTGFQGFLVRQNS